MSCAHHGNVSQELLQSGVRALAGCPHLRPCDEAQEEVVHDFDNAEEGRPPLGGAPRWRVSILVPCVERTCANEVRDHRLCAVSTRGACSLSVNQT